MLRIALTRQYGQIEVMFVSVTAVGWASEGHQKLEGRIEVSVDFHGDAPEKIADALKDAGAKTVRTK